MRASLQSVRVWQISFHKWTRSRSRWRSKFDQLAVRTESTSALSRRRKHKVHVHNLNSENEEQPSFGSESRILQAQHIGNLCPRFLTVHRHNVAYKCDIPQINKIEKVGILRDEFKLWFRFHMDQYWAIRNAGLGELPSIFGGSVVRIQDTCTNIMMSSNDVGYAPPKKPLKKADHREQKLKTNCFIFC